MPQFPNRSACQTIGWVLTLSPQGFIISSQTPFSSRFSPHYSRSLSFPRKPELTHSTTRQPCWRKQEKVRSRHRRHSSIQNIAIGRERIPRLQELPSPCLKQHCSHQNAPLTLVWSGCSDHAKLSQPS